ncbi:MAG: response regulator [Rhodobacteraceae bacterium]|nr:response regulator [Paracoccaceae bacterium]
MTNVVMVDDDRNILTSMSVLLEQEGFQVTTFTDPTQALKSFKRVNPDIAVLDMKMPRMDGLELLSKIRQDSDVPVMFLTSVSDEADEVMGLHMGADDFVRKPFSPRVMIERIRSCLRRSEAAEAKARKGKATMARGPLLLDEDRYEASWRGEALALTGTEFKLLQFLADKPGFVRSREQIQDQIYPQDVFVEDRSVDSHVKRLRKKLTAADPGFTAIESIYGVGYRFSLPKD